MNQTNLPLDVLKLYLKKSKRGKLVGPSDDLKQLEFVLSEHIIEKDPMILSILKDMEMNVEQLYKYLEEKNIQEISEILLYFMDKVEYLEEEKQIHLKSMMVVLRQMISLVESLLAIQEGEVDAPSEVEGKLYRQLRRAIDEFKMIMGRIWKG